MTDLLDIYTYLDFRKFLADYYEWKKASNSGFSYQIFSQRAGFASKSFIFQVIKGKKKLSQGAIASLCEAMRLTNTEATYFENLVFFNQAEKFKERSFYFKKLNSMHVRTADAARAKKIRKDQFDYFSQWYNVTIRALIDQIPVKKSDYPELSRMLLPQINPLKVKKSIELLERLKLIQKQANGHYKIIDKIVTTGQEAGDLGIQHFHLANMALAQNAMKLLPKDERNISSLTLGISAEAYKKICTLIYEYEDKILQVARNDNKADRVYQLNVHFFPVTKKNIAAR
ncbi:MAG: TIGR02147 family protein, partial [Chitinivibrionales bacterium]|nr:TIGR02147 family protein [Chitinivibrionales bacterium]